MIEYLIVPLLISALASIIVGLAIEKARIPIIVIGEPNEVRVGMYGSQKPIGMATSYRLRVQNKPLSRFLAWFLHRQVARECRATIRFLSRNGNSLAIDAMPGRWAGSVQPVPLEGTVGARQEPIILYDPARFEAASRIDIPAGLSEMLDIAIQFDSDTTAYGWTNSSYRFNGRVPQYRLEPGRYRLEVSAYADGITGRSELEMTIGQASAAAGPVSLPAGAGASVMNAPTSQSVSPPGA